MAERREVAWWLPKYKGAQRYKRVYDVLGRIRQAQSYQKARFDRYHRLYENSFLTSLGVSIFTRPTGSNGAKAGLNVTKSCCDSLMADVTAEQPKISFVTAGGDWDLQQRAQELEKFVDGQFYELGIEELGPQCELDAFIFGNGFLKLYKYENDGEETRICCERVLPWEMVVDDQEALYGEPRNLYQRKWVDRSILINEFPEFEDKILAAKTTRDDDDYVGFDTTSDQVLVTEAWHLPTYVKKKTDDVEGQEYDGDTKTTDGIHVICIQNATLFEEAWDKKYFPFVVFRKGKAVRGWWGPSLVQELEKIQYQINKLCENIDVSFYYLAAGHWLIDKNSKVNPLKVDNMPGTIIQYLGIKPECVVPEPVAQQVFAHLDRLYNRAYEISGISQLKAQGMKPPGLNSGKAIDSYLDVTTKRFANVQKLYHRTYIRLAEQILELSSEIANDNPDFDVMSSDENDNRRINFKKNELQKDEYYLKLYPTNAFSDDPSERLAQVQNMASEGWLDQATAKRLLWDIPDIKRVGDLDSASYNAVEACISQALKHGKYRPPAPFLDLQTAVKQVHNALVMAWQKGAPEDRLTMLRNWIADAQTLIQKAGAADAAAAAQAQAAAAPPGAAPGADGAPANQTGAGGMNGQLRPPAMPSAPSPFAAVPGQPLATPRAA